jgi:hypothetical protein
MPEVIQFHTLSKSDYKAARECPTKLYYREMKYPSNDDGDEYLKLLAQGGYMVEAIARLNHPDGLYVEPGRNVRENAAKTMEALQADKVTLFQPTILSGIKQARLDILRRDGNRIDVIEVKAKSFDAPEHFERVAAGKPGCFRALRKPFGVLADWKPYMEDVAFQVMLVREQFPDAEVRAFLCLVDKTKRTRIDELPKYFRVEREIRENESGNVHRFFFDGDADTLREDGLVVEVDVTAEVDETMETVRAATTAFETSMRDGLKKIPGIPRCACGECEYRVGEELSPQGFVECWGDLATVKPSVLDLHKVGTVKQNGEAVANTMLKEGRASLFDFPIDALVRADGTVGAQATRQRIQIAHTKSGTVWYAPDFKEALERAVYPLHFIDFEASRLAIPPHARMRSYGQVAFQWSCHTQASHSAPLVHTEWLNDRDYWPNAEFVRSLRDCIGDEGTVLTWSPFEGAVLKEVAREMHEFEAADSLLRKWIKELTEGGRILDMHKLCASSFFHPDMGGRTSIKAVLDALWSSDAQMRAYFEELTGVSGDPALGPYPALPEIQINGIPQVVVEGTGAIRAYQAMMYGLERIDVATRDQWKLVLLQYCKLDTLAMVLIWNYWMQSYSGVQ